MDLYPGPFSATLPRPWIWFLSRHPVTPLHETAPVLEKQNCLMVTKQKKIIDRHYITAVLIQRMDCNVT